MNRDVKSQTLEEIQAQFRVWEQPTYRAAQLVDWLYAQRATAWDQMTNLSKALRASLRQEFSLNVLQLVARQGASDSTQKFLWRLPDRSLVESVLIPASPALYGELSDRHTLCVSTQVGCAYGCKFCASGLEGWKRNLAVEEIVEQFLAVERWHASPADSGAGGTAETALRTGLAADSEGPAPGTGSAPRSTASSERLINNLVVMGMGEPLANYENLLKALRILNAPWGGGIGARKITVSTSGLAPQIRRLAEEPLQLRLAISLHGATDEVRSRLMPVNRKFPLRELTAACEYYQARKGRMITLEYILIAGLNDGLDQTRPLAELARRLNAKINLIPYNQVEGLSYQRPEPPAQEAFLAALVARGATATLRREKGHDIEAACGQLRLKVERGESTAAFGVGSYY